jgi:hypothetical protein
MNLEISAYDFQTGGRTLTAAHDACESMIDSIDAQAAATTS